MNTDDNNTHGHLDDDGFEGREEQVVIPSQKVAGLV